MTNYIVFVDSASDMKSCIETELCSKLCIYDLVWFVQRASHGLLLGVAMDTPQGCTLLPHDLSKFDLRLNIGGGPIMRKASGDVNFNLQMIWCELSADPLDVSLAQEPKEPKEPAGVAIMAYWFPAA
jgi:hypothetical protein